MMSIRKIFFSVLCICLTGLWGSGISFAQGKIPKKAEKLYLEAKNEAQSPVADRWESALKNLEEATVEFPGYFDAWLLTAGIYSKIKDYPKALNAFKRAQSVDSSALIPYLNTYAKAFAGVGNFREAQRLIGAYLSENKLPDYNKEIALEWKKSFELGLKSKDENQASFPVNLGDSVNSRESEYFPSLTIDNQNLLFTRNLGGRNEDFFLSKRRDSLWSMARSLPGGRYINTENNEGAGSISQDGKILLFTICNAKDGLGSCDIYYSFKSENGWTKPVNIGPPVNTAAWESQPSLSPDGRDLYFVSNRPGGKGRGDIYVSHIQKDGKWGSPVNLGDSVNTAGEESSPFIHADNMTLYFASDGHPGIGGVDLFYSRKKTDGTWSRPVNLGYPINTIDHDGSLFVSSDGETAYFASDRSDSRGKLDLYRATLPVQNRPLKTLFVRGRVFDQKTKKALSATVELNDLTAAQPASLLPIGRDGTFMVTLPAGKDYGFSINKKGYLFYSKNFSLPDSVKWRSFEIDISLEPIEKDAKVTLENVFFDTDQFALKPESFSELDKVVKLLEDNPKLKIRINGYTDSTGSESHNLTLSQNRAQAVVDYLTSRGIANDRLEAKGWGSQKEAATNVTSSGRAQNRRTELEILGEEE